MHRGWSAVIAGCCLATLSLGLFKYQQIQAAIAFSEGYPERSETVELAIATSTTWQDQSSVIGEVVAVKSLELSNEIAGRVSFVGFQPGAKVAAGQLLVSLDIREEQARRSAAAAEVTLALLLLDRNRKLIQTGVSSAADLDRAQAAYTAATSAVAALEAIIEKKRIKAPFAATSGLHQLDVGEYLHAGRAITRLVGLDRIIWIDFSVPQHQAILRVGDSVVVSGTAAQGFTGTNQTLTARIVARDSQVDSQSRQIRLRAEINNINGLLLPGSFVKVTVPVGSRRSVILIPSEAVRYDALGANVYVLKNVEKVADMTYRAVKRAVILGPQKGPRWVVLSGLDAGEQLAGLGAFKLRNGVLVRINNGRQAPSVDAALEGSM